MVYIYYIQRIKFNSDIIISTKYYPENEVHHEPSTQYSMYDLNTIFVLLVGSNLYNVTPFADRLLISGNVKTPIILHNWMYDDRMDRLDQYLNTLYEKPSRCCTIV